MKTTQFLTVILIVLLTQNLHSQIKKWKNNAKAVICLTYDDGMETHLSNAIPQLNDVGLKGTFFINTVSGQSAVVGWYEAAKSGHELANHSVFHPCPSAMGWNKFISTENYTIKRMLDEIKITDGILRQLDPDKTFRTFGYPCNNTLVGGKSYIEALKKSKLVRYARGGTEGNSIITDFKTLNPMLVPSWIVEENTSLDELIEQAEKIKQSGGMGIFQFHGIGGQWIKISNETHQAFLKYLKENEKEIWVATFAEAMEYIYK